MGKSPPTEILEVFRDSKPQKNAGSIIEVIADSFYAFTRLRLVSFHASELGGPQQCLSVELPSHDRREPSLQAFQLSWNLSLWVKNRALLGGVV
jgi:hypothetical protein